MLWDESLAYISVGCLQQRIARNDRTQLNGIRLLHHVVLSIYCARMSILTVIMTQKSVTHCISIECRSLNLRNLFHLKYNYFTRSCISWVMSHLLTMTLLQQNSRRHIRMCNFFALRLSDLFLFPQVCTRRWQSLFSQVLSQKLQKTSPWNLPVEVAPKNWWWSNRRNHKSHKLENIRRESVKNISTPMSLSD